MSDFKDLQNKWYAILEKEGFKDIEKEAKSLSGQFKAKQVEQLAGYYSKAQDFLNDYDFQCPKHKKIWELHTKGDSIRKIAKALSFSKSDVHRIVKKYANIMKEAY